MLQLVQKLDVLSYILLTEMLIQKGNFGADQDMFLKCILSDGSKGFHCWIAAGLKCTKHDPDAHDDPKSHHPAEPAHPG